MKYYVVEGTVEYKISVTVKAKNLEDAKKEVENHNLLERVILEYPITGIDLWTIEEKGGFTENADK